METELRLPNNLFAMGPTIFQYPNSPNLEKKKKKTITWRPNQWKKKKKKEPNSQPRRRKEKKNQKVVKSCGWVLFVGPLCVFNYNIAIELWVMETENSQNVFSVFITHNSKIRELSNENRVIVRQTDIELWVRPFLSYELWKLRIELRKQAIQTAS